MDTTENRPDYSLLAAFDTPIQRPRASLLYQFSLVLVTGAMLLLPLIYLALVVGAGWLVYYHATHNWGPIMGLGGFRGGGRIMIFKFLIYFIPLFAGSVVVFFMFKPLFAGQPKRAQPLALNPSDNPLLFALIERICKTVGAASPKRIDLDCQLNASAGFRRGLFGMSPNDMVLTIGLPLVANLTAREFAGVVAHEFGHFNQGVGMRLSYIIGTVNHWFARVVYQRDAWDVALEQWAAEAEDGRIAMIIWTTQIGVWFSRIILRILMYTGFLISGILSRQMEYNADACQIRVVGSEVFETTHRKLATLSAAMELTYKQIGATWKKNRQLPDNLSELLRHAHRQLPANVLQKIDDTLGLERTGLFDTHPSAADRIRQARVAADPGIFHDDRPASELFASFEHPARFVTLLHYTDDLGIPITDKMLVHVESTESSPAKTRAAANGTSESPDKYFLGILPLLLPLQIPPPAPSANYEADFAELGQLSAGLQQVEGQLAGLATQYHEATNRLIQSRAAAGLIQASVPMPAASFDLPEMTLEAARAAESEALATRDALRHSVHEVGAALQRRLQLALSLKLSDRGELGGTAVDAEQISQAVTALNRAAESYPAQQELTQAAGVFDRLTAFRDEHGESPTLTRALATQLETLKAFRPAITQPAAESQPRPAMQLRVSSTQKSAGGSENENLRQPAQAWFSNYHEYLNVLVEAARSGCRRSSWR